MRLDRFVFAGGTHAAPTWSRAEMSIPCRMVVPRLRSSFLTAHWLLLWYSQVYPPYHRVCVSLSFGFPRGVCFSDNPSIRALAGGSLLTVRPSVRGSLMVIPFRQSVLAALGRYYPPDSLVAKVVQHEEEQPPNLPIWVSLLNLCDLTTDLMHICFRSPLQPARGLGRIRLAASAPFHPAFRIDDQSLPKG